MNFTPKMSVRIIGGILAVAVVGSIGWDSHVAPAPTVATQNTFATQKYFPTNNRIPMISAVAIMPAAGLQTALPEGYTYQPITHWYKNKYWWKRNAPIVGGAAGGALIGGLAGGGGGALIGGAVGGGGGYAYKRIRRHEQRKHSYQHQYQHGYR
jgi:hypothetical protein